MKTTKPQASHRGRRQWGRAQLDERTDPYELADKLCPQRGAAYHKGRWQWAAGSTGAKQHCPACRRINDTQPAGVLTVGGALATTRRISVVLKHAFHGDLKLDYDEDGYFLRAAWQQD